MANELYHYGIKRRSGRYPWGSGERPYQDRKEAKRQKNLSIGRERLQNRIREANARTDTDKLAAKVGWQYTRQASRANEGTRQIKEVSREILEDEERLEKFGDRTRKRRNYTKALTIAGSPTLLIAGTAALNSLAAPVWMLTLPAASAATLAALGYEYLKESKY